MEMVLAALLGFRMRGPVGVKAKEGRETLNTDCCWCVPTQGRVSGKNSTTLTEFGFVSPSELTDFKHFHFHRNQQR